VVNSGFREIGGKTLHCLMKHARRQNGISDTCLRAVISSFIPLVIEFFLIVLFSIKCHSWKI
jgi:hypothetical protein